MKKFKLKPNRTLKNFKMYKDGKKWVFASTVVMLLGIGGASLDVNVPDSMDWLTVQQVSADTITGYDPDASKQQATTDVEDALQNIEQSTAQLEEFASGDGFRLLADNLVDGKLSTLTTTVAWEAVGDGKNSTNGEYISNIRISLSDDPSNVLFSLRSVPGKPTMDVPGWEEFLNPAVSGKPVYLFGHNLDTLGFAVGNDITISTATAAIQTNANGTSKWVLPGSQNEDTDPNPVTAPVADAQESLNKAQQMANDATTAAGNLMPQVISGGQGIADQAAELFKKADQISDPSATGIKDDLNQLITDLNYSVAFSNAANEQVGVLSKETSDAVAAKDLTASSNAAKKAQYAAELLDKFNADLADYQAKLQQITSDLAALDTNTGSDNSGDNNTGDSNTGNDNSGDNNTGNSNVGSDNSGDNNTGNSNTGSDNSGDNNTGNSNTGSDNSGQQYWKQ